MMISGITKEELDSLLSAEEQDRERYKLTDKELAPLVRYVKERIPTGDFLRAVLINDLREAAGRADLRNRRKLFEYCEWLYNEAPGSCWGSPEKVEKWLKGNGE